jgi:rhodanese-related sulfurtransferase
VIPHDRPLVVVAEPGREREAVTRLARVGYDLVAGTLKGGMEALARRPDLVARTPRLTARALEERRAAKDAPLILDCRLDGERADGFVPGSVHIPLSALPQRLAEVPAGRPVAVYCAGGYRSSIAASLLRAAGRGPVEDLIGGFSAWRAEGLPEDKPCSNTR